MYCEPASAEIAEQSALFLKSASLGILPVENAAGEFHRVDESGVQDGPAIRGPSGTQYWYLNDKCHRLDGPAIIFWDKTQYFILDGVRMTQEEWARDIRVVEFHSRTPQEAEEWLKSL